MYFDYIKINWVNTTKNDAIPQNSHMLNLTKQFTKVNRS